MAGLVVHRLGQAAVTLVVGSVLVWGLVFLGPGEPARQVLAAQGISQPRPEQVDRLRAELGLDRPVTEQYVHWVVAVAHGDLGRSWRTGRPVAEDLPDRLVATGRLTVTALLLGLLLAVPVASAGALGGRWLDPVSRGLMFAGASIPTLVVGVLLLEVVVLGLGIGSVVTDGSWGAAALPAVPLAVGIGAEWARVLRTGLDDALASGHAAVATARGASRPRLLLVHGLPHAAGPFLAVAGMTVGGLLAGAAVLETLFTWPGLGRALVEAIAARDLPVVQAAVLVGVLAFLAATLVADLLAAAIDPRLRR